MILFGEVAGRFWLVGLAPALLHSTAATIHPAVPSSRGEVTALEELGPKFWSRLSVSVDSRGDVAVEPWIGGLHWHPLQGLAPPR